MRSFHWGNIEGGFRGFENLALEYVAKEYSSPGGWNHTPYTRDGNRDACSIICGFRPNDMSPEEWWMEAKYYIKMVDYLKKALIYGHTSRISS